jgi:DNA polymerase IV
MTWNALQASASPSVQRRRKPSRPGASLRWLFLDLNAYFASVEQQENPRLRGKPIVVTAGSSDGACSIAASYEAKAFGIRTGTRVYEAKRLCPHIITVPARHDVYVDYHHAIVAEIEKHLHVTKAYSVDEVACELLGDERRRDNALALGREVQQGILKRVGECMRSSVGLGPSVLLAKTASDMKKPMGLTAIEMETLPGPLLKLGLTDLSGIGRNMERRLLSRGVTDVAALWALTPSRARSVWGSIEGERFWYALHGIDPPEIETRTQSIGHSHVLGPALRHREAAYRVARRLLARAAARMRRTGHKTGRLTLWFKTDTFRDNAASFPRTADTFALLETLDRLWHATVGPREVLPVRQVGVTLHDLKPTAEMQPDLFGWTADAEERPERLRLSLAIDRLNQRFGVDTVAIGPAPQGLAAYMGAKIAFNRIPDRQDFAG